MSQEELLRKVRCYFNDEEWAEMPEITKERYANIKRNYDAMIGLGLKPAMPEFMKTKPVPPKPAKPRVESRTRKQQKKKVNSPKGKQPLKVGAKGKENCTVATHAPRKKAWVAPVRNHTVLAENKEFTNGGTHDNQIAGASKPDGNHRPRRAQKINYAECDSSEEEPADKPSSSTENSSSEFRYPRRQRNEVNYMECEDGADEEYLFCDDCNMDYPGDCPVHGPLTHVKDTPACCLMCSKQSVRCQATKSAHCRCPLGDPQRANKTVPDGLLVRRSTIKGAQYGVFTIKQLSKRLCFGPYEGVTVDSSCANGYTWQIRHGGRVYLVDGRPLDRSNWMRYVNCAPQQSQQNLLAFVRQGAVYYRTNRVVYPGEELFVWYGDAFAKQLGLIGKSATASAQNKQGAEEDVAKLHAVFSCEDCGRMFTVQKMLDHHRRIKHHQRPQGKHSCAHCPYSSNYRSSVIRHERTHMGEKPFVCHVCCKGFTDHGHLKTHLLVHTGEKPYECSVCGQRFTTSSGMARHQRSLHSGNDARLHMCAQCGKGFMESSALTKHRLIHTGAKPHACSVCGVRFTRLGSAKKHELVVHGRQYPLHCPHCNKGFAAMCFLRKHMLAHHSDDSKENSEA
ncbi:hypothetical protein MRX96_033874 [Rhipicephalus microplus]